MNNMGRNVRQVIPFRPTAEFFYQKGMGWYQKGDLERAGKYLDRALKLRPDDVEYLCQQAAILSEGEYFERSNQLLKKVVYKIDPSVTECYFFLANNYAYLGEFQLALEEVQHYLAFKPEGTFAEDAADLLEMLTDETDDMAVKDEPPYVSLHEKGRLAMERGRFEEAIKIFRKIIAEKPDFLAAQNNLTLAYFTVGRIEEAIQTAAGVLSRDPGNVHTLCNLAGYFAQEKMQTALNDILKRLHRVYPINPDHCGKLGSTYLYIGDDRRAAYWLNQAEQRGVQPDQVFRFWQALAAFHLGHAERAERMWGEVDFFSHKPFHPFKYGKIQDMLYEADAPRNFMVNQLIEKELREDNRPYQLFSVFYLAEQNCWERLAELTENSRHPVIRRLAERLTLEMTSHQVDKGFAIIRMAEDYFDGQKELLKRPEIYSFWYLIDLLLQTVESPDSAGWGATLIYLWEKEYGQHRAQKVVAEATGTTVYRIRKHLNELTAMLKSRQME